MKFKLLVFVLIACNVFFSCAINKGLKDTKYTHGKEQYSPKFSWPYIKEKKDSLYYFCSRHCEDLSYAHKIAQKREICTCELLDSTMINIALGSDIRGGMFPSIQCILLYDSAFVSSYILPLFEKEEDRKTIEYTLLNANDSTFNDVIDFERKVIINENAWYYPVKSNKFARVCISFALEWLKTVVPQEKWIYCRDCYNEDVDIFLLVPLLESKVE